MSNITYRVFVEKLGDSNAEQFVGNEGDLFYDPEGPSIRLSDGTTPGGIVLGGGLAPWVRPSDWLAMPTVLETEQKFVGLFAVYNLPVNFIALLFEGDYTVDWGDGNVEDYNSGDKAQHSYDWADIPSSTLTSEGYRQVLVTVTPQAGQNLTILDISVRHDTVNIDADSPWLDLAISMPQAGSGTPIRLNWDASGAIGPGYLYSVQRIDVIHAGGMTDFSYAFYNSLVRSVIVRNSPNADIMSNMFSSCWALASVSLPDTSSVTDMSNMFSYCYALTSVSLPDTSSVTDMRGMFSACHALTSVSLPDTSSVTDMRGMFSACHALTTVSLPDTSSVTDMNTMFSTCYALTSVSLPDTSSVTDMSDMLYYCTSLQEVSMPGTVTDVSYAGCLLGSQAILDIFTELGDVTALGGKTINITDNYGVADLAGNYTIATNKGWTVLD